MNSDFGNDTRGPHSEGIVCYYYHKTGYFIRDYKKLQNWKQRVQPAHMTSTNETWSIIGKGIVVSFFLDYCCFQELKM